MIIPLTKISRHRGYGKTIHPVKQPYLSISGFRQVMVIRCLLVLLADACMTVIFNITFFHFCDVCSCSWVMGLNLTYCAVRKCFKRLRNNKYNSQYACADSCVHV